MELLPLPSPRTSAWEYNKWSTLPFLAKREAYHHSILPQRSAYLRKQILENEPEFVIFYGIGYSSYWQDIVGKEVEFQEQGDLLVSYHFPYHLFNGQASKC
jgi:hypothetical protein